MDTKKILSNLKNMDISKVAVVAAVAGVVIGAGAIIASKISGEKKLAVIKKITDAKESLSELNVPNDSSVEEKETNVFEELNDSEEESIVKFDEKENDIKDVNILEDNILKDDTVF